VGLGAGGGPGWLGAGAGAYVTGVEGAIARSLRDIADCPPTSRDCQGAWFRYQLVNLDGPATVRGAEVAADATWDAVVLRATVAYAHGDGPNPEVRPADPTLPYVERVPLSRVPPLNGTAEARWRGDGRYAALGLRWATAQDRLAPVDRGDPRIPAGGTPGHAVVDLRAGVRLSPETRVAAVLENVLDAAYRYHGSSIDGPGRSLLVYLELTP